MTRSRHHVTLRFEGFETRWRSPRRKEEKPRECSFARSLQFARSTSDDPRKGHSSKGSIERLLERSEESTYIYTRSKQIGTAYSTVEYRRRRSLPALCLSYLPPGSLICKREALSLHLILDRFRSSYVERGNSAI